MWASDSNTFRRRLQKAHETVDRVILREMRNYTLFPDEHNLRNIDWTIPYDKNVYENNLLRLYNPPATTPNAQKVLVTYFLSTEIYDHLDIGEYVKYMIESLDYFLDGETEYKSYLDVKGSVSKDAWISDNLLTMCVNYPGVRHIWVFVDATFLTPKMETLLVKATSAVPVELYAFDDLQIDPRRHVAVPYQCAKKILERTSDLPKTSLCMDEDEIVPIDPRTLPQLVLNYRLNRPNERDVQSDPVVKMQGWEDSTLVYIRRCALDSMHESIAYRWVVQKQKPDDLLKPKANPPGPRPVTDDVAMNVFVTKVASARVPKNLEDDYKKALAHQMKTVEEKLARVYKIAFDNYKNNHGLDPQQRRHVQELRNKQSKQDLTAEEIASHDELMEHRDKEIKPHLIKLVEERLHRMFSLDAPKTMLTKTEITNVRRYLSGTGRDVMAFDVRCNSNVQMDEDNSGANENENENENTPNEELVSDDEDSE